MILVLFASFVSYVVPIHIFNQKAYADGLTQESLPPIIHMLLFEGFQAKCKILAWQNDK